MIHGAAATFPRHPDGGDRGRLPVARVAKRRRRGFNGGAGRGHCARGPAVRAWRPAAPGRQVRSCCPRPRRRRRDHGRRQASRALRGFFAPDRRRGAMERGARQPPPRARTSGFRLFHRRLVPDLQGERGGGDRSRRGAHRL